MLCRRFIVSILIIVLVSLFVFSFMVLAEKLPEKL